MTSIKLALLGIVVASLFLAGCVQTNNPDTNYQQGQEAQSQGRVVFAIKDAAANMDTVSKVEVTIESVEVHSATEGWVTLSSTQTTFDLLKLKNEGSAALLADANLSPGTYQQLRLDISNVIVTDANGTHEAKLPSNEFKTAGELVIESNSTSTVTLDFLADQSLHVTGNGEYIMAPVVQVETRKDTTVIVQGDNTVHINGGSVVTNIRTGMGADGMVRINSNIPFDANLTIEGNTIQIHAVGRGAGSNVSIGIGTGMNNNSANANSTATVTIG